MTTPATTDVAATVGQIQRLVDAGCEIVRITVPSSADAAALPDIRREMAARGIKAPLVADIHFSPQAALLAVPYVEKVRINPGNYADKKRFKIWEYSDDQYAAELQRLEERLVPLLQACRQRGVSMRIGTNHGSLSDRILNRYGDTPLGWSSRPWSSCASAGATTTMS
jgi:(E)-4-hydroxy-3-methylbut-2-enyl-diphosphate synthase